MAKMGTRRQTLQQRRPAKILLGAAAAVAAVSLGGGAFCGIAAAAASHRFPVNVARAASNDQEEWSPEVLLQSLREALGGQEGKLQTQLKESAARVEAVAKREAELQGRLDEATKLATVSEEKTKPLYAQVVQLNTQVSELQKCYQELTDALEFAEVERDTIMKERDILAVKLADVESRAGVLQQRLVEAEEKQAAAEAKASGFFSRLMKKEEEAPQEKKEEAAPQLGPDVVPEASAETPLKPEDAEAAKKKGFFGFLKR